jgi:hypothetical protein
MRDKRIKLFNDLVDLSSKRGEIEQFEQKYKDFNGWVSFNFKNEQSVTDLYNKTIQLGIFSRTSKIQDFFKVFACDLQPNSQYCTTQQTPTPNPAPTTNVFGCILKDESLMYNKQNNTVYYKGTKEDKSVFYWGFYSNNRFYSTSSNKLGSWSCDGPDGYTIKYDDNSDTFHWKLNGDNNGWDSKVKPTPTTTPSTSNTTTITNTTLTADDLVKGGIVKLGMKGDIVGKIQELLISKGHKDISKDGKVDKIFGRRTKKMVKDFQSANGLEDDGVVGRLTWAKLSDPSLTKAQTDAAKSQLPVNHGKIEIDDSGNPFVFDGYKESWVPQSEFLQSYNADGTKKLQENIIKNIVLKNLHSLL